MTAKVVLHLKVGAGRESLADLVRYQSTCLKRQKPLPLQHVSRLMPKRRDEILGGGSIYWVIKGHFIARQKISDLKPLPKYGEAHFAIIYEPKLTLVAPRQTQQIEGWRYLPAADAPPDLPTDQASKNLPEDLILELFDWGLL